MSPDTDVSPWQAGGFVRLYAAHAVSTFGDFLVPVALAVAVLGPLGGGPAQVGFVVGTGVLGTLVGTLLAGVVTDRVGARRVMVIADAVRFVTQAAVAAALLGSAPAVEWIVLLNAVRGVAGGVFEPAATALLPQVVARPALQRANGAVTAATAAAMVTGPLVAGALGAASAVVWVFVLDAATFAASGVLLVTLRPRTTAKAPPATPLGQLRAGWVALHARPGLAVLVWQSALVNLLFVGPLQTLAPVVAGAAYGDPSTYGLMAAALGAGTLAGAVWSGRLRSRRPLLVAAASLLPLAPAGWALAASLPLPAVLLAFAAGGAGTALHAVLWRTAAQTQLPAETLGRVAALDALASYALMPAGSVLAGLTAGLVSPGLTLTAISLVLVVVTLPTLFMSSILTASTTPIGSEAK